jgi:heat shock protein HslJ
MKKFTSLIRLLLFVSLLLSACNAIGKKPTATATTALEPSATTEAVTPQSPIGGPTSTPSGVEEAGGAPGAGGTPTVGETPTGGETPAAPPVTQLLLPGSSWRLEAYRDAQGNSSPPLPGSKIDAVFSTDGKLNGNAGCNNYSATYQIGDQKLTLSPVVSTQMACPTPAGVMEQETAYLGALQSIASYKIENQKLTVLDAQGKILLIFVLVGGPSIEGGLEIPPALDLAALRNMQYQNSFTTSGYVPLVNGEYHEPVPNSASTTDVLMTEYTAYGKLPDGKVGAAVILTTSTGGSGSFFDLELVVEVDSKPLNISSVFLGDRVQINSLKFEDGDIVVDMISQGPNDPVCCPTQAEIRRYRFQDGNLQQTIRQPVQENALIGVVWRWVETKEADNTVIAVDTPTSYTLEFTPDGRVQIMADCNSANAMYVLNGTSLTIQVQEMTTVACQPGSLSERFLRDLNYVVSFAMRNGDLYLTLLSDSGVMKLQPAR